MTNQQKANRLRELKGQLLAYQQVTRYMHDRIESITEEIDHLGAAA